MFQLIHYKRTAIKGKYAETCTISYDNERDARKDGETTFKRIIDPAYAGYAIKDGNHTLCRRLKVKAV